MADLEKKDEKTRQWRSYSCSQLSAFCLQISLLLEAAVPLDEGFSIMAEDAEDENEKKMLLYMAEGQNWEILVLRYWKIQAYFRPMWSAWQSWDRKQVLWIR